MSTSKSTEDSIESLLSMTLAEALARASESEAGEDLAKASDGSERTSDVDDETQPSRPRRGSHEHPPRKKARTDYGEITLFGATGAVKATIENEVPVVVLPAVEETGLDPSMTSLCADLCRSMYDIDGKDTETSITSDQLAGRLSKGPHKVELVKFENHGDLGATTPPFALVVTGQTMILAWRGSTTIMDWINDFAMAPITSPPLLEADSHLRLMGSYLGLVENDLALHEGLIVDTITGKNKRRKIENIIFTGHSLAGGMAQVAHIVVESLLRQGNANRTSSTWSDLPDLTCRSVLFAAPMTVVSLSGDAINGERPWTSSAFLQDIAANSCNIVYGLDAVPHGFGDVGFIEEVIKKLLERSFFDVVKHLVNAAVTLGIKRLKMGDSVQDLLTKVKETPMVKVVARKFHHVGKIIYYPTHTSTPEILQDYRRGGLDSFRDYDYVFPAKQNKLQEKLKDDHSRMLGVIAGENRSKSMEKDE